jgi:hypothetical protein
MPDDSHVSWLLASTLAALLAGPLLSWAGQRLPGVIPILRVLTAVCVALLVFGFLLPDAFGQAGWWIAPAALLGFALLNLLERVAHLGHRQVHAVAILVSLAGLLLHMALDGVALHGDGDDHHHLLGVGVVLHRIPVGIALWGLVRPRFGNAAGWTALFAGGAATVAGAALGDAALGILGSNALGLFQAFVAGALMHVLVHVKEGEDGAHDHSH